MASCYRTRMHLRRGARALLPTALLACGGGPPVGPSGPSVEASPVSPEPERGVVVLRPPGRDPVRVAVEVARTRPARARGLMHRRELADDAGMLFVFEASARQWFWMENTLLSLDIIFIDANQVVVGVVERARPLSRERIAVDAESRFVLEVVAGFAARHGIGPGTEVRFEPHAERGSP